MQSKLHSGDQKSCLPIFYSGFFREISFLFSFSFFQNKICFRLQHNLWMENLVYKSICISNFSYCFKFNTNRYFGWLHRQHILLILQLSKSFRSNELRFLRVVLKLLRFIKWLTQTSIETVHWFSWNSTLFKIRIAFTLKIEFSNIWVGRYFWSTLKVDILL